VSARVERFLWISLAGALGTGARYLIGIWAGERFGAAFPYGTLIVNLIGCFAMGLVVHVATSVASLSPTLRLALTTGFLGGLTTYSSFNHETTSLIASGARGLALLNASFTLFGCFAAGLAGLALGRLLVGS
jgi:fluoride exporter